jgi:DNA-binding response OmpR family regulator
MQILVVEDEIRLAKNIATGLKNENYTVELAHDGEEAISKLYNPYDVIILDLMLPKKSWLEVLKTLRGKWIKTPVIILSAKWEIEDKVQGLKIWADDYLVKPFSFDELIARIQSLLRRSVWNSTTACSIDSLSLDSTTKLVTRKWKILQLSSTEFRLLEYLLFHRDEVISETRLLEHVWDRNYMGMSNVVSVYIRYLRNKVDKDFPDEKPLIHTRRWLWYIVTDAYTW